RAPTSSSSRYDSGGRGRPSPSSWSGTAARSRCPRCWAPTESPPLTGCSTLWCVFDSVGWGEVLVLVVAGLFILGPERLPSAAAWVGRTIRQVRGYATGARDSLRKELGPEFDELRKPLEELQGLRNFNPRSAVR